jgi:hypothetical protein
MSVSRREDALDAHGLELIDRKSPIDAGKAEPVEVNRANDHRIRSNRASRNGPMFEKESAEIHNHGRDYEEPEPGRWFARPYQRVRHAGENNEQQRQHTFQHTRRDVARIKLEWQCNAHTCQSTETDAGTATPSQHDLSLPHQNREGQRRERLPGKNPRLVFRLRRFDLGPCDDISQQTAGDLARQYDPGCFPALAAKR